MKAGAVDWLEFPYKDGALLLAVASALSEIRHTAKQNREAELARERIHGEHPLAEVACDAGFADQAHFTRAFTSAFGLTPARYRALRRVSDRRLIGGHA